MEEEAGADYIEHGIKSFFTVTPSEMESNISEEDFEERQTLDVVKELLKGTSE